MKVRPGPLSDVDLEASSPAVKDPPEVPNAVTPYRDALDTEAPAGGGVGPQIQDAGEARRTRDADMKGSARQQAALARLGLEVLVSRDLGSTLEVLVREAATALRAEFGSVLALQSDRLTFVPRADFGGSSASGEAGPLPILGDGQATYTLRASGPVVSADLRAETRFEVSGRALEQGARSGVSAIVPGKQHPWGVVGAHARTPLQFTEHDANFLQAIANLMALAIERDRLETALGHLSRQQSAVVRLGSEALASHELDSTLDRLVREAGATLRADFGCVLELDDSRSAFHLRASFGWPVGSEGAAALSALGDSQAHYTVSNAAPVVSHDLRTETRFTIQPLVMQQGARSGMSVIMQGTQKVWGVLSAHTKVLRRFSEDDVNFLQAIANLMALAIERDRVEIALRHRNRQQAAVAALGRRTLVGPHMDDLFADVCREVASTLQVDICEILQRNPDGRTLLLRAGVGWQPGLVGTATVSSLPAAQAGFTLDSDGPVVVTDLDAETRFEASPILLDHRVVSGISVLVPTRSGSFGVIGGHSLGRRAFTQDDSNFLQAVANLLAGAIERHRVEGELRRHRDNLEGLVAERTALLEASNRELEAFSYTISHDLRAPLRSINGLSKILQRKHADALPEGAKSLLGEMADETVRMGVLIESILSLSRLGSIEIAHVPVDVSAASRQILEGLQADDPARKVAWTVERGVQVVGDEALLRVVLENLLGNAWKFTRRVKAARIVVAAQAGGFRVEDNGAGFDMARARELFQPFHRLHAPEDFEGTGIGLATVNRIIARHSGRVWAEASLGHGATFNVAIPHYVPPVAPLVAGTFGPSHKA